VVLSLPIGSRRALVSLSTRVLSALNNPLSHPLAVFGSYGYRLLIQGFDDLPRLVVFLTNIEGHTTPHVAVGEDILQVGDRLEVGRHLTFFGTAEALKGFPVYAAIPEGQQLLGFGQAVTCGTGSKRDADIPAPELLFLLLRLTFDDTPALSLRLEVATYSMQHSAISLLRVSEKNSWLSGTVKFRQPVL
jgi:hypothetical protein